MTKPVRIYIIDKRQSKRRAIWGWAWPRLAIWSGMILAGVLIGGFALSVALSGVLLLAGYAIFRGFPGSNPEMTVAEARLALDAMEREEAADA